MIPTANSRDDTPVEVDADASAPTAEARRERDRRAAEHMTVMRCQMGDRDAFEKLFDRYNDRLLYYLRRLLPSAATAEDVLQDVWVRVLRRVATLNDPGAFRSWVFRIAHNRAMSVLRRRGRSVQLRTSGNEPHGAEAIEEPIADDFEALEARLVHDALERIGATHREVLTLRFLGELTYAEIAAVVDCPMGTVKSRIYHAKKALRQEIERQEGSPDPSPKDHGVRPR